MDRESKPFGQGRLVLAAGCVFVILFLAGLAVTELFDLPRLGGRGAAGIAAGIVAGRAYGRMRRSLRDGAAIPPPTDSTGSPEEGDLR